MDRRTVDVETAKERLVELVDLVERGERIVIARDGRPVAVLAPARPTRQPVDIGAVRDFLATLPPQTEDAAHLVRRMRDEGRS